MQIARAMAETSTKALSVRESETVDAMGAVSPHSNRATAQAFIHGHIIILDRHSEHALRAAVDRRQRRAARR